MEEDRSIIGGCTNRSVEARGAACSPGGGGPTDLGNIVWGGQAALIACNTHQGGKPIRWRDHFESINKCIWGDNLEKNPEDVPGWEHTITSPSTKKEQLRKAGMYIAFLNRILSPEELRVRPRPRVWSSIPDILRRSSHRGYAERQRQRRRPM